MLNDPPSSHQKITLPSLTIPLTVALLLVFHHVATAQLLAFHSSKEKPVRTLYLHCGNPLTLDLPADIGEVAYDIQGGELVRGDAYNQVIVIPKQASVTLRVLGDQRILKNYQFQVRRIPLPGIVLRHQSGSASHDIRIPVAEAAALSVHAVPDEDLGRFLPRDARFKLLGTVSLVRNAQTLRTVPLNGSFDRNALGSIRPGDKISISVEKLLRKNFRDEVEERALKKAKVLSASVF